MPRASGVASYTDTGLQLIDLTRGLKRLIADGVTRSRRHGPGWPRKEIALTPRRVAHKRKAQPAAFGCLLMTEVERQDDGEVDGARLRETRIRVN